MEPILNPLIFYLIFLSGSLGTVLLVLSAGSIVFALLYVMDAKMAKAKKFFIIGVLILLFKSVIPNEKTCYQMLAASAVTPNNLTAIGETAEDIVNYIVNSVDQIIEEKEENDESNN